MKKLFSRSSSFNRFPGKPKEEDFTFPVFTFNYDPQQVKSYNSEGLIVLVQKLESHIDLCKDTFQKSKQSHSDKVLEIATLKEKTQLDKERADEDIATLKVDIRMIQNNFDKIEEDNIILGRKLESYNMPNSNDIEELLANIHAPVSEICKLVKYGVPGKKTKNTGMMESNPKDELKEYAKLYEDSMKEAEEFMNQIHKQFLDSKKNEEVQELKFALCEKEKDGLLAIWENRLAEAETDFECLQKNFLDKTLETKKQQEELAKTTYESKKFQDELAKFQIKMENDNEQVRSQLCQKEQELGNIENQLQEKAQVEVQVSQIQNQYDNQQNQNSVMQVDTDKIGAEQINQRQDHCQLNESYENLKEEYERGLISLYNKEEEIEGMKNMFKKMVIDLKIEKKMVLKKDQECEKLKKDIEQMSNQPVAKNQQQEKEANDPESQLQHAKAGRKYDLITDWAVIEQSPKEANEKSQAGSSPENNNSNKQNGDSGKNSGNGDSSGMNISSGGRLDLENPTEGKLIECSIEIETLKAQIMEQECTLSFKDSEMKHLEDHLLTSSTKITDLKIKRKNALQEIQNLQDKYASLSDSPKKKDVGALFTPSPNNKLLRHNSMTVGQGHQNDGALMFNFSKKGQDSGTNVDVQLSKRSSMLEQMNVDRHKIVQEGAVFQINPEKFNKFSMKLTAKLKDTYMKFVEVCAGMDHELVMDIERGLNESMMSVKSFTTYVDEILEYYNIRNPAMRSEGVINLEKIL